MEYYQEKIVAMPDLIYQGSLYALRSTGDLFLGPTRKKVVYPLFRPY